MGLWIEGQVPSSLAHRGGDTVVLYSPQPLPLSSWLWEAIRKGTVMLFHNTCAQLTCGSRAAVCPHHGSGLLRCPAGAPFMSFGSGHCLKVVSPLFYPKLHQ